MLFNDWEDATREQVDRSVASLLKAKPGTVTMKTEKAVENILQKTTLNSLWQIREHPEDQGTSQLESFHAELRRLKVESSSHESLEVVEMKVGMAVLKHNRDLMLKNNLPRTPSLITTLPILLYVSSAYKNGTSYPKLLEQGYVGKKYTGPR
jgi:hypothetical protein